MRNYEDVDEDYDDGDDDGDVDDGDDDDDVCDDDNDGDDDEDDDGDDHDGGDDDDDKDRKNENKMKYLNIQEDKNNIDYNHDESMMGLKSSVTEALQFEYHP